MKLQELSENILSEMLPMSPLSPQPVTPDPTKPEQSPQAQMAQHQKDVTARRKQLQDQINLLNRQIADLKKQLSTLT
jgi:TolA-binding protein